MVDTIATLQSFDDPIGEIVEKRVLQNGLEAEPRARAIWRCVHHL